MCLISCLLGKWDGTALIWRRTNVIFRSEKWQQNPEMVILPWYSASQYCRFFFPSEVIFRDLTTHFNITNYYNPIIMFMFSCYFPYLMSVWMCVWMDWHPIWAELSCLAPNIPRIGSRCPTALTRIKRSLKMNEWVGSLLAIIIINEIIICIKWMLLII